MPDPITIPAGDVQFYDNYVPSLKGDIYDIVVQSGVDGLDTENYFSNPLTQRFEVRAPQFTIDPTEVHAVYPPEGSNAIFDQVLPHVILDTPALPWERYLDLNDATLPWMALLVFAEGEIAVDPLTHSSLTAINVNTLLTQTADGVLRPAIKVADVAQDVLNSNCQTITISASVFTALVPQSNELKYLSHIRQVNTGNQAAMGGDDTGWYSVIVGNRLLVGGAGGTRFYVHLVSLEGFLPYINGTQTISQQQVQLVSLYNWSFISQPETGASFRDLAENFVAQAGGNAQNLLFRRSVPQQTNPDTNMQQVITRLNNGYVALSWQSPSGENTFAWYRGPFSPVIAQPLPHRPNTPHYPSASAAMIYDPVSGVFDHSYAAAWSIGRALALSDGTFGPAMLAWRRKTYALLGRMLDALHLQGIGTNADLAAILAGNVVRNAFDQMIASEMTPQLTSILHQPVQGGSVAAPTLKSATPPDPVSAAQQYLAQPQVQALMKAEVDEELQTIAAWIAKKQLLYNVPFNQLVPDPAMLPQESLRFFYVDQNWLDVLTDGALSLGIQGSKDAFVTQAMRNVIDDAVKTQIQNIRAQITGISTGDVEADSPLEAMSGILIRSAMISGWPGLQVTGTYQGQTLKILRMDHLADDVLLVIFLDIPDTVTIAEPQQGLRFGVEDGNVINLRYVTGNIGQAIPNLLFPAAGGFQKYFRTSTGVGANVISINAASPNLINDMTSAYPQAPQTLRPADFAVQMVKAPEQLSFNPPAHLAMEERVLPGPPKPDVVTAPPVDNSKPKPPADNSKPKPPADNVTADTPPKPPFWVVFAQWLTQIFSGMAKKK